MALKYCRRKKKKKTKNFQKLQPRIKVMIDGMESFYIHGFVATQSVVISIPWFLKSIFENDAIL